MSTLSFICRISGVLCIIPAAIGIPITLSFEHGSVEYEHGYPCFILAFLLSVICVIAGRLEEADHEESDACTKKDDE